MDLNLYWGDIHGHAFCGNEFSSPEKDLANARSHLDFWAPTEHAIGQKTNEERFPLYWAKQRKLLAAANRTGEFVALMGWEWADVTAWSAGDMCVYFPDDATEDMPIPRTYQEMIAFVCERGGILIPHHVGYMSPYPGTAWDKFNSGIMPAIEIFSMHGCSERDSGPFPMNLVLNGPRASGGTVFDGLGRGLRFGIIASTDQHVGYPGAYRQGLMAAYAPELSRKAIWEALRTRRTYAVTGDRIRLGFAINGQDMGSEVAAAGRREIAVNVHGEDMLNEIDIIKNGRLWKRETCAFCTNTPVDRVRVRIEWGYGWGDPYSWSGHLAVCGGRLLSVTPHFGPPGPNRIIESNERECRWESVTYGSLIQGNFFHHQFLTNTGGNLSCQIVVEVQGTEDMQFKLGVNGKDWVLPLKEFLAGSKVLVQEGNMDNPIGARKIKVHQAIASSLYTYEGKWMDDVPERATDWYLLRVTQANGQMAWSSPIWVSR